MGTEAMRRKMTMFVYAKEFERRETLKNWRRRADEERRQRVYQRRMDNEELKEEENKLEKTLEKRDLEELKVESR